MSEKELYLIQSKHPQSLDGIDIKTTHETLFCAHPAEFHIVGESHAVSVPALPFYEIFSCQPVRTEQPPDTTLNTIELCVNTQLTTVHTLGDEHTSIQTTVRIEPLESFPDARSFTIIYKFDTDAYTAINCLSQREYRTYHTYPEHDLTVISCHQICSASNIEPRDMIEASTQ